MRMLILDKVFRHLKVEVPLTKPISYRRKPLIDDDGLCIDKGDCFAILIRNDLPEWFAVEVLIHEYAHAVAWGRDDDLHGYNWGLAYSLVYRTFLEFYQNANWEVLTNGREDCGLCGAYSGKPGLRVSVGAGGSCRGCIACRRRIERTDHPDPKNDDQV